MINAKEAHKESDKEAKLVSKKYDDGLFKKVINEINDQIESACDNGEYSIVVNNTSVLDNYNLMGSWYSDIKEYFESMGFKVNKTSTTVYSSPMDEREIATMEISWKHVILWDNYVMFGVSILFVVFMVLLIYTSYFDK